MGGETAEAEREREREREEEENGDEEEKERERSERLAKEADAALEESGSAAMTMETPCERRWR